MWLLTHVFNSTVEVKACESKTYTVYIDNYAKVLKCRRFGLSMFWFVDILGCGRYGMSSFWFVDVLVCRHFGLSTFRFVDILTSKQFKFGAVTTHRHDANLTSVQIEDEASQHVWWIFAPQLWHGQNHSKTKQEKWTGKAKSESVDINNTY